MTATKTNERPGTKAAALAVKNFLFGRARARQRRNVVEVHGQKLPAPPQIDEQVAVDPFQPRLHPPVGRGAAERPEHRLGPQLLRHVGANPARIPPRNHLAVVEKRFSFQGGHAVTSRPDQRLPTRNIPT